MSVVSNFSNTGNFKLAPGRASSKFLPFFQTSQKRTNEAGSMGTTLTNGDLDCVQLKHNSNSIGSNKPVIRLIKNK